MQIQPNATGVAAAAAGTARAQSKGSDTETGQTQQASLNRSQSPGKANSGDQLAIDASGESGDRDADGRQLHDLAPQDLDDSEGEPTESRRGIALDDSGSELDLDA